MCGETSEVLKTSEVYSYMQKSEPLIPGKTYKIVQHGNGDEPLFFEYLNKLYFQKLVERHLCPVCVILDCELKKYQIEMVLKFREESDIPKKFSGKLHLPLSNLFNSYAKSINKRYNRKGSLFRTRFERREMVVHNF